MLLFEREMIVPDFEPGESLVRQFQRHVEKELPSNTVPVRVAITESDSNGQHAELGLLQLDNDDYRPASIFEYQQRSPSSAEDFNVVLLVPTGIGAEIGGRQRKFPLSMVTRVIRSNARNPAQPNTCVDPVLGLPGY